MNQELLNELPIWRFENLSPFSEITHFVTERRGGVSLEEKSSLNLGKSVGDDPDAILENRRRLVNALRIGIEKLVIPHQTHTNHVESISTENIPPLNNTDALVTNKRGICLTVLAADCVPVLLYDPKQSVIAAVHSGWRGTTQKIVTQTILKMIQLYNCSPQDILAGIGPSIGPTSYEVGEEVIQAVISSFGENSQLLSPGDNGKGYLNLWKANQVQMEAMGIPLKNIEIAGICTFINHDQFFSARHSKNKGGRFSAGIMLN